MAEKHVEKHTIACYEADANQWLKPTAMLDRMQEIAGRGHDRWKRKNVGLEHRQFASYR